MALVCLWLADGNVGFDCDFDCDGVQAQDVCVDVVLDTIYIMVHFCGVFERWNCVAKLVKASV